MTSTHQPQKKRIEALDYLRGYFIVVIIIDHLERWPSLLSVFTGKGLLWSNASDGFVITAGLLVGYIRGFKARDTPFRAIAKKLFLRSFWLYVWSVVATVLLFSFAALLPIPDNVPQYDFATLGFFELVKDTILLDYIHPWVYFLHLYTIYMLLSIGAVWLLRKNLWWIIALLIAAAFVYTHFIQSPWIERAPLFFIPVIIGYYLEPIKTLVTSLSRSRLRLLEGGILTLFLTTLILSLSVVFLPQLYPESFVTSLQTLFSRDPINFVTAIIATIWYLGLFIVFHYTVPFFKKYLAWLILPFSTGSFSAYTVHGVPLILLMTFSPFPDNIIVNTIAGFVALVATLLIIRVPFIKRVIPQ